MDWGTSASSSELGLYMMRVDQVIDAVCGPEYRDLLKRAESDPEGSELLYRRAFALFKQARQRVEDNPEEYQDLITWRREKTLHGIGRPGVQEAFTEEWIDTWYGNEPAPHGD